jgi:BirA family biotin operon repressor/biotin-[acetyl-CoA-carboxylase] ligase
MSEDALPSDPRLGRALLALVESKGVLSVPQWAQAAGVATGDLWKLAGRLRALGVELTGSAAEGYRLTSAPELPLPELLEPRIAGTIFAGRLRHFLQIGSTNAAAMRAGAEAEADNHAEASPNQGVTGPNPDAIGADHGQPGGQPLESPPRTALGEVWLAEQQTAGKGRAGHAWSSQPGDGIYCSVLLRPRLAPSDAIILSLAAGLAVAEAVHEVTGLWADLRWPNDLLLGGKKFCGILTELNAEVTRVRYVVVGVGINVNNPEFPPGLAPIATSLHLETGQRFSRLELVASLLRALDREQAALCSELNPARQRILRRFEQHSSYCRDCAVSVEEDGGYRGVTRGLDERGFLRVETPQGMRTVLSGGVRKRQNPLP